jgi:hypothetical protein
MRILGKVLFAVCIALWSLLVLGTTARPAHAYVDPGSGLLFIQMVGSTFAGITFLLRKRVREFFGRLGRPSAKEEIEQANQ